MSVHPPKNRPRQQRRSTETIWLQVTQQSGLDVSDHAFARLSALNPDLRLERSSDQELIVMTPAGAGPSHRGGRVFGQLCVWSRGDKSGIEFDSSVGFTLPNGAIRGPDASWISRERWNALGQVEQDRFSHITPDFVVEVISPSDEIENARAKMREYIEQGARLGWLIDPQTSTVEVYRACRDAELLVNPPSLSGEDVLPGFVLDLSDDIFGPFR